MRLLTEKGQMDLPAGFSFSIEQNSPVFSHEGTQSIPITLPASPRNLQALSYPNRIGRRDKYIRKYTSKLEAGLFQKTGQLVVDSVGSDGIIGAIMLNESELYTRIKDIKLSDIFSKIIRNDFAAEQNPIEAWYNHIYKCMKGEITDDFTAFPVAVDYNEENGYQLLNCPDYTSTSNPWQLKWAARDIYQGTDSVSVPVGFGITPFLWMWRAIELIFAEFGYSVDKSPFKDNPLLKKIALINNNSDTICKGVINYADLVPTCSISEFLIFIENKFLTHAYIYPEEKSVELISLDTIISSAADEDISLSVDGIIKYLFVDAKEVNIQSNTDLPGAKPAADTIFDLAKNYTALTEINETEWNTYNWGSLQTFKHHLIIRKSTGQYYDLYYQRVGGRASYIPLGTNYFRFCSDKFSNKMEYKSEDVMPVLVEIRLGLVGELEAAILCLSIGASRTSNISLQKGSEKTNNSEQNIIIAYAAGKADETAYAANDFHPGTVPPKYYLGTTQKRNNAGNAWCDYDLTTTDIYKLFFRNWNGIIKNCTSEIECKVDYSDVQFLSLRHDKLKAYKGQPLLLKSLSYSISNKIIHNLSKFMLIKKQYPLIEEEQIPFSQ